MERDVSVREVMDREFLGASESDGLREAAELMLVEDADSVVVLRGSDPVGVVTERDLMTASPFSPTADGPTAVEGGRAVAGVSAGRGQSATERRGEGRFADQSLCEACGSLARDLSPFNGQLLCSDCRDI